MTSLIQNVSDTARWIAVYRARESMRSDALFRDPFAERLAGERGQQIAPADGVQFFQRLGWQPRQVYSLLREAHRLGRLTWWLRLMARLPQPDPRSPRGGRWSALARLQRSAG